LGIGRAVNWSPAGNVIATLTPSRKIVLVIFLTVASISWFKFYPNRSTDARCQLVLTETRTAVYGPVRTVVWPGSAGDRRPYADLVGHSKVIAQLLVNGNLNVCTSPDTYDNATRRPRVEMVVPV